MKNYRNKDDKDLIFLVCKNDEKALKELIFRYESLLMRIANFYIKESQEAEEIVADFFFGIWQKRKKLIIEGNVKNYFSISIKNNCLTLLEKNKQRTNPWNIKDYENIFQDGTQPDDHLISEELKSSLKAFLETLPEQRCLIFSLAKFEGLTFYEIADLLNISPKTVANQVALALKRVTVHLKNHS